jgi:hypothetical protein
MISLMFLCLRPRSWTPRDPSAIGVSAHLLLGLRQNWLCTKSRVTWFGPIQPGKRCAKEGTDARKSRVSQSLTSRPRPPQFSWLLREPSKRAGRNNTERSRAKRASSVMPIRRSGNEMSQTNGKSASARIARGQQSTNRRHHPIQSIRVFMISQPMEKDTDGGRKFQPSVKFPFDRDWIPALRASSRWIRATRSIWPLQENARRTLRFGMPAPARPRA